MLWGTYSLLNKITMMSRRMHPTNSCTQNQDNSNWKSKISFRWKDQEGSMRQTKKNGLWIRSWRKMGFQHIKRKHPWIRVIENTRQFWYDSQWGIWEMRLDHGNENNEKEKPTTWRDSCIMGDRGEEKGQSQVEEIHTKEEHINWLKSLNPGWVGE